ncbi:hypothetical protein [Ruminiclostridium hungatei]|uniref:hypothetical protein n=1 Tax=Ruminiclostridium hungatei TaxID=48256 RepID=UPI0013FD8ACB|nr:hypothetical protein [Ruminiclostridium hungatei]
MKTSVQKSKKECGEGAFTYRDVPAMLIAFVQVLGPFIIASLAAFSLAAWLLMRFWVD